MGPSAGILIQHKKNPGPSFVGDIAKILKNVTLSINVNQNA